MSYTRCETGSESSNLRHEFLPDKHLTDKYFKFVVHKIDGCCEHLQHGGTRSKVADSINAADSEQQAEAVSLFLGSLPLDAVQILPTGNELLTQTCAFFGRLIQEPPDRSGKILSLFGILPDLFENISVAVNSCSPG